MADEYRRLLLTSRAELDRERLLAEAFEFGAEGVEEIEALGEFRACIYAPVSVMEGLRDSLLEIAPVGTVVGQSEPVLPVDWSEAWKEGLEAIQISSRLVVRPPFVEVKLEPGQVEVVIEPGQAFGTGGHASTRLCLEWVDVLYSDVEPGDSASPHFERVLDVGTGSGVLAMAAVALGAGSAVGFDLDAVAVEAARNSAIENGLADRTEWIAGPIEAVSRGERFPLVVANLLKREILPIATQVAARVPPGGRLVLAGLLLEDEPEVLARFEHEGLALASARRTIEDGTGVWVGLCLERRV